jgi:hypothetical protein
MKSKKADGPAGQAGKERSRAKKSLPRRPQDTVQDLAVRRGVADAVKGGIPKQPDSNGGLPK